MVEWSSGWPVAELPLQAYLYVCSIYLRLLNIDVCEGLKSIFGYVSVATGKDHKGDYSGLPLAQSAAEVPPGNL